VESDFRIAFPILRDSFLSPARLASAFASTKAHVVVFIHEFALLSWVFRF
jgi:hypothetical protein